MKQSNRINYMDKSYEMDLTQLDRLPTNTGIALIDRLNTELNDQSEILEDMFTEIACENMDNPRKCAFYKELRKKNYVTPVVSEYDKEDIRLFHRSGRHSKTELQELYGLRRKEINEILGDKGNRLGNGISIYIGIDHPIDVQDELYQRNTEESEEEDDFDTNNADYLAILEEVQNNPRD